MVILNSYHQGFHWSDQELAGLLDRLHQDYPRLDPRIEHLDAKRSPGPDHRERMRQYLVGKYRGRKIDLVLALDNDALDLALRYRQEIFPGVPLVFAGISDFTPALLQGQGKVTGVAEVNDIAANLELALSLHPGTKEVLVINDYNETALAVRREMEAVLPAFEGRVKVSFNPPATFQEVQDRVKSLPPKSLVLIAAFATDRRGDSLPVGASTPLLVTPAVPLYATNETRLGHGIVGGVLLGGREQGQKAGGIALKVLAGEDPSRIPVITRSTAKPMFDYLQLQRFQIPLKALPPDSVVINWPQSFYERYRPLFLTASAIIFSLTITVIILSAAIIRRRRAEERLGESKEKFRLLVENANEIILVTQGDRIRFANPRATEISGYSPEELASRPFLEFVHPDDREMVREYHRRSLQGHDVPIVYYFRYFHKDGALCWAELKSSVIIWGGDPATLDCITDITERKEAEEALRTSHSELQTLHRLSEIAIGESLILEALTSITEEISRVTGYPVVAIERYHPDRQTMEFIAASGLGESHPGLPFEVPVAETLSSKVVMSGQPLVEHRALLRPEYAHASLRQLGVQTFISVPMLFKKGALGALSLAHTQSLAVDDRFLNWIRSLANYIAVLMEHRQSQEALETERRILQDILEATLAGYWDCDVKEGIEYLSPTFKRMFGYEDHELPNLPKTWQKLIFPEDLAVARETYRRHVQSRGEIPYYNEVRYRHKNGSTVWVICTGKVIEWSADAQPLRMVGCHVDITGLKQAEQELRESEERFRLLVENAPDAIFIRHEGRFAYVNKEALRLFGAAAEDQLLGRQVIDRVHPDCQDQTKERMRILNEERKAVPRTERQYLKMDGAPFDVEVSAVPFRYQGQNSSLIFFRDITERKKAEEAQKMLEAQLYQTQKMEALGTLAGGIAHDFNNVLGAMMGFAELANMDLPESSEGHYFLENLLKAGDRARHLVKQILSFSRQEKVVHQPVSLTPLVKETLKFLRASLPTTIKIRTLLQAGEAMVVADPTQIHQILLNLGTNAAHAMEEKGGTLEVSLRELILSSQEESLGYGSYENLQPGAYLDLRVSDTGHGMEPAVLERIFDPFFTTKEPWKGTGMGLAVVYGIVKSMNGVIQATSRPGIGTTFQVLLLLATGGLSEAAPDVLTPLSRGVGRILFVDDDEDFFRAGQRMLAELGYEVVAYDNSLKALDEFEAQPHRFDLIISDQTMPGLTGLELAEACFHLRPDIPFILSTGYSETVTPEKVRATGIREVVAKPFNLHQIGEIIENVFKEKQKMSRIKMEVAGQ